MWRRWALIRQFKLNLLRFIRLHETPNDVARGFALGIAIGMTPTFGFQMIIAAFFAMLLRENKLAAVIGVWITNPLTAPFIYAAEYETGRLLLGLERVGMPEEMTYHNLCQMGSDMLLSLGLGSVLFACLGYVLTYAFTLRLLPSLKQSRIPRWPRPRRRFK
jgi:uncharacterized protein (DUF2062 family)